MTDEVILTSNENPLLKPMRDLYRAYVRLLESAKERIEFHGGTCDSVEQMERGDPYLIAANVAMQAAEIEQRHSLETCEYQQVATAESGAIVWKDSPMKLPVGTPIFVKWNAPKASSEVFPCTHLGCNEPDGSKCRHWPRGSQKALEPPKASGDVLGVLMVEEISAMHDELKANAQGKGEQRE